MEKMLHTHTCGELNRSHVGDNVVLNGWVHRTRDHGGILFIDLRDRSGITQIVVDPEGNDDAAQKGLEVKFEYCIAVKGKVRARPDEMINKEMPTGEIEIQTRELSILSTCDTLPFMIDDRSEAREDLRLRYRYLDLRSFSMHKNIRLRHETSFAIREYLVSRGFYEIETPTLIRSTPEGARDFLVPSRLQGGKFYALPQSPQIYKQLLMVSGFEKYFQIAHCFRDEDARGDRQLEHTQIDIEMSFASQEDVFELTEGMIKQVFAKALDVEISIPFPRISYTDAMNTYGSDRPDLRFELTLSDFSPFAEKGDFEVFKKIIDEGGTVKALVVAGGADLSRKQISDLEETAKTYGARGLAWMKVTDAGLDGGISRFYAQIGQPILDAFSAGPGDLILMVGSDWKTACTAMGAVRNAVGATKEDKKYRFCWVTDFPLFEWNEEDDRWDPAHHMFTMPQDSSPESLENQPGEALGYLYDLVCNGVELASGSIRIHDPELQKRIFKIIGLGDDEASQRFGFLLDAFQYGPPPHGGIAPGLDRLVMLMAGETTIRQVIAFPKNTMGVSPMDDSPSVVEPTQLKELGISILPSEDKE